MSGARSLARARDHEHQVARPLMSARELKAGAMDGRMRIGRDAPCAASLLLRIVREWPRDVVRLRDV